MIRRTEYSRARYKTSRRRLRGGGDDRRRRRRRRRFRPITLALASRPPPPAPHRRRVAHVGRTVLSPTRPCKRAVVGKVTPGRGTGARTEGKHGGEVANIWGSGGRATRALIELYESRYSPSPPPSALPPLISSSSLLAFILPFLLLLLLLLLCHFLGLLIPSLPCEGPPFRSLSLALFVGKVLERVPRP